MISHLRRKLTYILLISIIMLSFLNSSMLLAQLPLSLVLDIAWSPDGTMLAIIDSNGSLIVRESNQSEPVFQFMRPSTLLKAAIAWNNQGDRLIVGIGNRVYIWQVPSWQLLHEFEVGLPSGFFTWGPIEDIPEGVQTITLSSDDRYIVIGTYSYQTSVWDTQAAQLIFQEGDLSGGGPGRVWLNDGWLGDGANKLNIYTNETILAPANVSSCRFTGSSEGGITQPNPNNNLIAWGLGNGPFLQIRDLNTLCGVIAFQLTTDNSIPSIEWISDISWNGKGDFIVAISSDGELYVANLTSSDVETVLNVTGELYAVDWNPSSNEIIYSGVSETGQPILEIVDVTGIAGVPLIPSISLTESGTSDTYTSALEAGADMFLNWVYRSNDIDSEASVMGISYLVVINGTPVPLNPPNHGCKSAEEQPNATLIPETWEGFLNRRWQISATKFDWGLAGDIRYQYMQERIPAIISEKGW